MSTLLSILLIFLATASYCRRVYDICSNEHPKRVFLGLGESGVLTATNLTHFGSANTTLHESCRLEIVTCPSCVISLTFRLLNLSCQCGSGLNLFFYNPCRCDYVWITEPPYDIVSGASFCRITPGSGARGGGLAYKSKTRIVRVSLFYSRTYPHAFTVEYVSETNRQFFFGTSQYPLEPNVSTGFISSPFFPAIYPRDLAVEYVLTCVSNASSQENILPLHNNDCRVHLTFTDFQLAPSSVMEFYDGSRRLGVISGTSFRPPALTSVTNSVTIRFYAAGQSNIGFKAVFSFISESLVKKMAKPSTDCGGYVDNFGGTITMMKMVDSQVKVYDCIWLIKPVKSFFDVKSHLYLKITSFLGFAGDAELLVRQGLTSESPILERVRSPVSQNFQEHVIPLNSGYYVSLRASFGPASHFAVTYASFSRNKCFVFSEYLCRNFRCISKKLACDGFDHCGDNSDEPPVCHQGWRSEPGKWFTHTPNYFFPKMKEYSDLKSASVVFLVCLVGLIFLISGLSAILCRIESKSRRRRDLQDQLQSVRDCLSDEVSIEDVVIDDPPSYEAPPNYEEVIKMSLNVGSNSEKYRCQDSPAVDDSAPIEGGGDPEFCLAPKDTSPPIPPAQEVSRGSLESLESDFASFPPCWAFREDSDQASCQEVN